MSSRYRDLVKQGSPLLLAMVLASLAVYGFHFYASRRLGVDFYGALASLLGIVTFVSVIAQIGGTITARLAAELAVQDDRARMRRLLDLTTLACGAIVAIGIGLTYLFREPVAQFFRLSSPWPAVWTAAVSALVLSGTVLRGLMQGAQQFTEFSTSVTLENVGRALLGAIAIAAGYALDGAIVAQALAVVGAAGYTYARLRRRFAVAPARLQMQLSRLAATSAGIAIATACLAVLSYFDLILAKHYLPVHEAGLYGFGTLPGRALTAITITIPTLILPKAAAKTPGRASGSALLYAGLGAALAFSIVALVVFYAFSHWIVVFSGGRQYAFAAPLVFPYGCAAAAFGLTRTAVSYHIGAHRFAFVPALAFTTLAEIGGIAAFHRDAAQIVLVVLAANVVALAVSLLPVKSVREA